MDDASAPHAAALPAGGGLRGRLPPAGERRVCRSGAARATRVARRAAGRGRRDSLTGRQPVRAHRGATAAGAAIPRHAHGVHMLCTGRAHAMHRACTCCAQGVRMLCTGRALHMQVLAVHAEFWPCLATPAHRTFADAYFRARSESSRRCVKRRQPQSAPPREKPAKGGKPKGKESDGET